MVYRTVPRLGLVVCVAGFIGIFTVYKLCTSIESEFVETYKAYKRPGSYRGIAGADIYADYKNGTPCRSVTDIVFLKIHKCSSTTVQNLLLRFGEKHDLTFVLPPHANYLGDPQNTSFDRKYMIEYPDVKYNILCHHTRFNEENIVNLMPSDSVYITILRDPVTMYESLFTYAGFAQYSKIFGGDPVTNLAQYFNRSVEYSNHLLRSARPIS
ncbi:galactosylceramide sulfotransferase-like [Amphiura filiformis]|uniref:galactosylceramide sulfotransferase-like n=1 Tax=Amphiura filiformis TaxID=82378 RepID=UPI003B220521